MMKCKILGETGAGLGPVLFKSIAVHLDFLNAVVQYVAKKSLRPDIKDKERPLSKLPFF